MVIKGITKCWQCLKSKKGCKFSLLEEKKEEEEEEEEEKEEVEAAPAPSKLPVAKLKKILSLPIHSLHKRKEDQLLPESQKKAATLSTAIRVQRESPEVGGVEELSSVGSMPPPSIMSSWLQASSSSRLYFLSKDYWVQLLQTALWESEEDLSTIKDQFASQESLYLDQIMKLEKELSESCSKGCR